MKKQLKINYKRMFWKEGEKDYLIQEIYENERLVGYQHFNPKTKGFVFIFSEKYPRNLRKKKREELLNLAETLMLPSEIKEE